MRTIITVMTQKQKFQNKNVFLYIHSSKQLIHTFNHNSDGTMLIFFFFFN